MSDLKLPLLNLRDYQQVLWDRWFTEDIRMMSQEWHRRCGKDLFDLQIMIAEALRVVGNYWFLLPETLQVRNSIWEGMTSEGISYLDYFPKGMIRKLDNISMKVYLRNPNNPQERGSIITFLGGDRYDKRVGAGLKGAVISEHSLQKPNLYDLAIEPMLKETKGWVIFNYTPRGENHATKMYDFLATLPKKYITSRLTIDDTGLVSAADLQEERARGKPEEIIQQEYYCSREGAIYGSYYGSLLKQYKKDHVGKFSYDAGYPVHTLWDLGISDTMTIWFIQFIQKDIHVIDYYENTNYALGHYASVLQGKGYLYAMHHLPHDGAKRQLTSDEKAISIEQQLKNLNIRPIKIHPPRLDIYGAIQRTRTFFSRCYFNEETTKEGYEALKQYRRDWDESRQIFRNIPLHNWASHAADAFSLLPLIESQVMRKPTVKTKKWNGRFR